MVGMCVHGELLCDSSTVSLYHYMLMRLWMWLINIHYTVIILIVVVMNESGSDKSVELANVTSCK